MRLRRRLLTAILVLATVLAACAGTRVYSGIRIDYPILVVMADIQSQFDYETILCLTGRLDRNGVVVVDGIRPPYIAERSRTHVVWKGCPKETVAWYHNHPNGREGQPICWPSPNDLVVTDSTRYHAMVLTCSKSTMVYRFRRDTVDYVAPLLNYPPILPGKW